MSIEDAKQVILTAIYGLIETEPSSKSEMTAWYDKAKNVKNLMKLANGDLGVPHCVWHYLDDADIRMKDPRYAQSQISQTKQALRNWATDSAV